MSIRSIICAATLLTAAVQPVWASPAPPPAEAKAETAPPSARALQLAHQIVVTLHLSETIANMVKSMMPAMIDHRMKTDPNFKPEWRQPLIDATTEAAADVMPGFIKEAEVDYARVFTEEEMTQMLAFYGSPVGQSVLAKQSEPRP